MFKLNNKGLCSTLTNNQGFSLLEVLVGVSIIAIVSAIAVPTYQKYTKDARLSATSTSISNIKRSVKTCFSIRGDLNECRTQAALGIKTCEGCKFPTTLTPDKFCMHIASGKGNDEIRVCISSDASSSGAGATSFKSTYGGKQQVCLQQCTDTASSNPAGFDGGAGYTDRPPATAPAKWTGDTCSARSTANAGTCQSGECQ